MRDLTSIENLVPTLDARLAVMYSELIRESKHVIKVDKSNYFQAEAVVKSIKQFIACDTDLVLLNSLLNKFFSLIHNCKDPVLTSPEYLELYCIADQQLGTFWVPDQIECETGGTTTTTTNTETLYPFLATITSFIDPDEIGSLHAGSFSLVVTLLAETGAFKQFIEGISTFFDIRTLSQILYWNESFGLYMPENKLEDWEINDVLIDVDIYKQIIYTGPRRGSIKVKLIFI